MRIVNYIVTYGVTSRHLSESIGVFNKLSEAKAAYNGFAFFSNFKAKQLTRLSYPDKWAGANNVTVLCEVVA